MLEVCIFSAHLLTLTLILTCHVPFCPDVLQQANLEPEDTEQVIEQLHRELLEAQELANTGKQKCHELQGISFNFISTSLVVLTNPTLLHDA